MRVIRCILVTGDSIRIVAPEGGVAEFMAERRMAIFENRDLLIKTFNDKAAIWRFAGIESARDVTPIFVNPHQMVFWGAEVEELELLPVTEEMKAAKAAATKDPFTPLTPGWVQGEGFKVRGMTREEMLAEIEKGEKQEDRE